MIKIFLLSTAVVLLFTAIFSSVPALAAGAADDNNDKINCTAFTDRFSCNNAGDGTPCRFYDYNPSPNGFCFSASTLALFSYDFSLSVMLTQAQCNIVYEYAQQEQFYGATQWCANFGRCVPYGSPCDCTQVIPSNEENLVTSLVDACSFIPPSSPDPDHHFSSLCKFCPSNASNSSVPESDTCVPHTVDCSSCSNQRTESECHYFLDSCFWCSTYNVCLQNSNPNRVKAISCSCEDLETQVDCNNAASASSSSSSSCSWCPKINRCVTKSSNAPSSPCSDCGYALDEQSCATLTGEQPDGYNCVWCSIPQGYSQRNISLCQQMKNTTTTPLEQEEQCSCTSLSQKECPSSIVQNWWQADHPFADNLCKLDANMFQCTSSIAPASQDCTQIPNEGDCLDSRLACKWCEKELGGGCVNSNQDCTCYNLQTTVCPAKECAPCLSFQSCMKKTDMCVCFALPRSNCDTNGQCMWSSHFDVCVSSDLGGETTCIEVFQDEFSCSKAPSKCQFCWNIENCIDKDAACSCLASDCQSPTPCTKCPILASTYPSPSEANLCLNISSSSSSLSCPTAKYCYPLTEQQCFDSQSSLQYCTWCPTLNLCIATIAFTSLPYQRDYGLSFPALNDVTTCSCNSILEEEYCGSGKTKGLCNWCPKIQSCLDKSQFEKYGDDLCSSSSAAVASSSSSSLQSKQPDVDEVICELIFNGSICNTFSHCYWSVTDSRSGVANQVCVDRKKNSNGIQCQYFSFQHSCLVAGCLWCDSTNNNDNVHGCVSYPNNLFQSVPSPLLYCSCQRFLVDSLNDGCEPRSDEDNVATVPAFKNAKCKSCRNIGVCVRDDIPCSCDSAVSSQDELQTLDAYPGVVMCSYCTFYNISSSSTSSSVILVQNRNELNRNLPESRCTCSGFAQSTCSLPLFKGQCSWCGQISNNNHNNDQSLVSFDNNYISACVNISEDDGNSTKKQEQCQCSAFTAVTCPTASSCQVCAGMCIDNVYGPPQQYVQPASLASCMCHSIIDKNICNNQTAGFCFWQNPILVGSTNSEKGYCGYSNGCQNPLTCAGLSENLHFVYGGNREMCAAAGCSYNPQTAHCTAEHGCFIFFLPSFVIQPVILLMIGFAKDIIVLMIIGAFGDIFARAIYKKFACLFYKMREWDESQIEKALDETVYIMDKRCVDSSSFKFAGDYCNNISFEEYSKQVATKLFDVPQHEANAGDLERRVKLLMSAVNFSLVSDGLWIDLSRDLSAVNKDTTNDDDYDGKENKNENDEETKLLANDATAHYDQNDEQEKEKLPIFLNNELFTSRVLIQQKVSEIVTKYSSAFVFYARSRDVKLRLSSCFNSFPSSLQLLYYVSSVIIMALSVLYSVAIEPENRNNVEQIASYVCNTRTSFDDADFGKNNSNHGPTDTTSLRGVPVAEISYFLIGFRLLNASALSTAMLILVKTVRGLLLSRYSKFYNLSLTRQLPLLGLYSSRQVHIILLVYFLIFAPFLFAGIIYWFISSHVEVVVPLGCLLALLLMLTSLASFVNWCQRKPGAKRTREEEETATEKEQQKQERERNEYESSPTNNQPTGETSSESSNGVALNINTSSTSINDNQQRAQNEDDDEANQLQREEREETFSNPDEDELPGCAVGEASKRTTLANFFAEEAAAYEKQQNKKHENKVASKADSTLDNDQNSQSTINNIKDNDNREEETISNASELRTQNGEVQQQQDEEKEKEEEDESEEEETDEEYYNRTETSIIPSLLSFCYYEEIPTILCTLGFQFCFNYMVLFKFGAAFGIVSRGGGGALHVAKAEWAARSVSCVAESFEGDISGIWSTLSSFLPFS